MTFEIELFHGKIYSFATRGQTMTRQNLGPFVLFLERKGCLNCDVITRCGTWILLEPVSFDDILSSLSDLEHRITESISVAEFKL